MAMPRKHKVADNFTGCRYVNRRYLVGVLFALLTFSSAQGGDIAKGKQVYRDHCEICHGPGGRSNMPGAGDFTRGHGLMQPDTALLESIRAGKYAMPGFLGVLSDEEILDVISYLRTFH